MELQSIEQKQKLLRDEIIGKQIDPQAFMEFMGKVKGQGDNIDLDNWTISELMEVIESYKQEISKNRQELLSSRISRDLRRAKIFISYKKDKVKYEGTNVWDFQENYEQECSRSEMSFQFPENITPMIQIEKWEIKSVGGFIFGIGARNQLEFTISSNFTTGKVVRKDEDCDWLRSILISKHAGSYVPPLQQFREFSTDDKKGINARIQSVTQFLNTLLKYPTFHYSLDFKHFLTQNNYRDFNDHKSIESAIAVEKDLLEIGTPSGKFNVIISDSLNQTIKQSSRLSQEFTSLYGQLYNCLNKVITDIDTVSKSIRILTDVTGRVGEKYNEIQKVLKHGETKLPAILLSINESTSIIFGGLKSQISSLSDFTNNFIKPTSRDWNEFQQFTRRHQNQIKSYLTAKQNLIKKKEKYLTDPTKWELPQAEFIKIQRQGVNKMSREECFEKMFPGENDKENRTRIWLSFVNQNYLESFKQFLTEQEKSLLQSYLTFTEKQMGSASEINLSYQGFRQMIGV